MAMASSMAVELHEMAISAEDRVSCNERSAGAIAIRLNPLRRWNRRSFSCGCSRTTRLKRWSSSRGFKAFKTRRCSSSVKKGECVWERKTTSQRPASLAPPSSLFWRAASRDAPSPAQHV